MTREHLTRAISVVDVAMLGYLIALAIASVVLTILGWRAVDRYVRRRPLRDYGFVARSPLSLPVSILVPAHNEGPVIVPALHALLASHYVTFEVVVVNDGSTDDTLASIADAFGLVRTGRVPRSNVPSRAIKAVYTSSVDERIVVVDKENGGKADALNAGLAYARYPLVCALDADTMLDPAALSRLVWELQSEPETIATGGIVRIVNGSTVIGGRLIDVRTPRSFLGNVQILEYLRAFLGSRLGWSHLGMLLIISGAFGLFRRDVVVAVGGWDTESVGEDAELIVRLHRYHLDRGIPYRITFFPDPICWTEAPSSWRVLVRQRDRWQRGLIQLLHAHRSMLFRRRYGRIGSIALPYFAVFEALGPIVEITGYAFVLLGLGFGIVSPTLAAIWFGVALSSGFVLSFAAILMEERAFRRYPKWRCLGHLVVAAIVENLGYRQVMLFVRARAWWTVRHDHGWGAMPRAGFGAS